MRWGVALNVKEKLSDTIRKAEIADQGGIDQVWVTDFPAIRYAPAVAAAIAERTTVCRIGVGLMSPLLYSETQITQFMSTLMDRYGERFDLLLGPGDRHALASIGVKYSTKDMVDKTKTALEKVKQNLSESGYKSSVLLGAQGPVMVKASLKADGVLLNYADPKMIEWALDQIKERIPKEFHLGIFPPTFVGNCEDFERNQRVTFSAAMVAIGINNVVSELFGFRDKIEAARGSMKKRGRIDSGVVKLLGREILQKFVFCGPGEQLKEYLIELEKIGISSVVFGPPQGIREDGVEILVDVKSGI